MEDKCVIEKKILESVSSIFKKVNKNFRKLMFGEKFGDFGEIGKSSKFLIRCVEMLEK